jgi:hypothetical protein
LGEGLAVEGEEVGGGGKDGRWGGVFFGGFRRVVSFGLVGLEFVCKGSRLGYVDFEEEGLLVLGVDVES